jgi:hypothetical protein
MRAHGRESHNHEVSLSHRFGELMSVMQADDPDAVARGPFPRAHGIQARQNSEEGGLRSKERDAPEPDAKAARTGEVSVDIGAKAGISGSLRCLPLAEFGSVFADFHVRRFVLDFNVPQKSRDNREGQICSTPIVELILRFYRGDGSLPHRLTHFIRLSCALP